MASTGRMEILPFLLFVLFKSGTSSTPMVNIIIGVGHKVSLPCNLSSEHANVVQMQWHREVEGHQQGRPIVVYNVRFQKAEYSGTKARLGIMQNPSDQLKRFYLDLEDLEPKDSGVYVCSINTFPSGTITQFVNLQVEAEEDKDRPVTELITTEVPVTTSSSSTTAIKVIFSTALTTGGTTARSDSSTSENEPDASSVSISSTTSNTREPQTSTKAPLSYDSNTTVTVAWTEYEQNTTYDRQNVTVVYQSNATTVLQSITGTQESKVNNTSVEESTSQQADSGTQATAAVATVTSSERQNHGNYSTGVVQLQPIAPPDNSRQHLPLIIILPILALLLCLGLVYRRYLIRKRLDGPPSFKPPPPPVKYTSMIEQQRQILMLDIPA
ncbi:uncharacterized protein si:ch1073-15f19.2 [Sardina pilchardus]|uniref:uncharacterized protein si:ch1073-15f19.2 n=1 Tax=Sardina pilchardus TaxID=27697 RepID=UPI002E0D493E